jgi:hypothetical protein
LINLNLNKLIIITGILAVILVIVFWFWWGNKEIEVKNDEASTTISNLPRSKISGIPCENADRRPISIMLAADPETRPLSGISEADMVFEMPVTPNDITRFMAVFQCQNPTEIGSIRSARNDFIPLASGLDSVYAHWGGEREALQKLNGHIVDNIDAVKYEGTVFYRKKRVPMPHNGFTDLDKITDQAKKLDYGLINTFSGYLHEEKELKKNISNIATEIKIDYAFPYNILWVYDSGTGEYKRSRGNKPEIDRNNNSQVSAKVVIVMKTKSKYLNKDYIAVETQGGGEALIYQNGTASTGRWRKDPSVLNSKLYFYNTDGDEIKFLPGKIWVEIITKN